MTPHRAPRAALVAAATLALAAGLSPATPATSATPLPARAAVPPRTVLDVRGPRAGRAARGRVERAALRPDRHPRDRRHAHTRAQPPRPVRADGLGHVVADHRAGAAVTRWIGADGTPAGASGAPATAWRSRRGQGRRLLWQGRQGLVDRRGRATGCCRSTRSPSPARGGRSRCSVRTARRARPATAARSTSTAPPRLLHLLARHRRPAAAPAAHLDRARAVDRRHHLVQRHRVVQRDDAQLEGEAGAPATTSSPTSPRTTATSSAPRRTPTASARRVLDLLATADGSRGRGRSPRPATAARRRTSTRSGRTPTHVLVVTYQAERVGGREARRRRLDGVRRRTRAPATMDAGRRSSCRPAEGGAGP